MMNLEILDGWLVCLDSIAIFLIVLGLARIPDPTLRLRFTLLIVAGLLYVNPLLLFWYPSFEIQTRLFFAKSVFSGIVLLSDAFVLFVIAFCRVKGEYGAIRFSLFQLSVVSIVCLAWAGYLPEGVLETEGRISLRHGFGHTLFLGITIGHVLYILFLARKGYRETQEEIVQFQVRYLIGAGAITAVLMVLSNSVIPYVTGNSTFAPLAALELMFFWSAALYILLHREFLLLRKDFRGLLKVPAMAHQETFYSFRTILYAFEHTVTTGAPADETVVLRAETGDRVRLRLSAKAAETDQVGVVPIGWYEGQFDELERLRSENFRLTIAVDTARRMGIEENRQLSSASVSIIQNAEPTASQVEENLTPLEQAERGTIVQFLERNNFNQRRTSAELGIRPNTLIAKMRRYNIRVPGGPRPGRKPGSPGSKKEV